jgi:hypothetical protein
MFLGNVDLAECLVDLPAIHLFFSIVLQLLVHEVYIWTSFNFNAATECFKEKNNRFDWKKYQ